MFIYVWKENFIYLKILINFYVISAALKSFEIENVRDTYQRKTINIYGIFRKAKMKSTVNISFTTKRCRGSWNSKT